MNIICQEATDADLSSILALHKQLDLDGEEFLSVEQARPILRKFESYPDYRLYVATINNEVVGTFTLLIMDNLAHMGASSGIVEDVVVEEGLRGKGIGKVMMQFAMDLCREKGCYKVMLSSNMRREAAHRFYQDLGFRKHGYSFVIDWIKTE